LYSIVEASLYAFVASMTQSWVLQYHILRDNGISGMDSDFDNALDGLHGAIPDFNVRRFTCKDIVPSKADRVLASAFFSKSVQDMKVKFNMTTRRKTNLGCFQATHALDFLLAIPIDYAWQQGRSGASLNIIVPAPASMHQSPNHIEGKN